MIYLKKTETKVKRSQRSRTCNIINILGIYKR